MPKRVRKINIFYNNWLEMVTWSFKGIKW